MNRDRSLPAKAAITAVGSYVPEDILSNQDLAQMVDTNDEWIRSRTGIVERRIARDPEHATGYMAIQAAQSLLQKKNIDPTTIDVVLVATITPDYTVSPTAPYVATEIGAGGALAFDLQAACSGFLYGLSTASAMIASGLHQRVLLIGADKMSSIVNYSDRSTCIIFGDGAAAVLVEPSDNQWGYEGGVFGNNGIGSQLLNVPHGGSRQPFNADSYAAGQHYIQQEGRTVFKYAVNHMASSSLALLDRYNLTADQINYVLPHQANKRIIDATREAIGVEEEKVLTNIAHYGNTTAATIPLLLSDFEQQFSLGDRLILTAFGGGFTWGAAYITWNY